MGGNIKQRREGGERGGVGETEGGERERERVEWVERGRERVEVREGEGEREKDT